MAVIEGRHRSVFRAAATIQLADYAGRKAPYQFYGELVETFINSERWGAPSARFYFFPDQLVDKTEATLKERGISRVPTLAYIEAAVQRKQSLARDSFLGSATVTAVSGQNMIPRLQLGFVQTDFLLRNICTKENVEAVIAIFRELYESLLAYLLYERYGSSTQEMSESTQQNMAVNGSGSFEFVEDDSFMERTRREKELAQFISSLFGDMLFWQYLLYQSASTYDAHFDLRNLPGFLRQD